MRLTHLALLIPVILPLVAQAGETPWQEVAPGVSLRLIGTGTVSSEGQTLLALEVRMPESTKTYWRVPGEAGLPTEIDVAGSSGIVSVRQLWPYPRRHEANGLMDYVYFGDTVLPFEVTVADPMAEAVIQVTMGICSEICVPAQGSFRLAVADQAPDAPNGLRIRQALAEVPLPWMEEPLPVGGVWWSASDQALAVNVDTEVVDPESLIATTGTGHPVFGAPQKSPQPGIVLLPMLGKSDNIAVENLPVVLTFMTDSGAFEVEAVVGGTASEPVQ